MRYSEFTSEDFIMDDHFKRWVITPDQVSNEFWSRWLQENPGKKEEIEEARQIILGLNFKNHYPSYDVYLKEWDRLNQSIDAAEADPETGKDVVTHILEERIAITPAAGRSNYNYLRKFAASVVVLLIAGIAYFTFIENFKIRVSTGIGETKQVLLPDHSLITLNANSKLTYKKDFAEQDLREVWLEGEGFFEVAKRGAGQRFKVHGAHLTVEVLGTKFNFSDRKSMARIVLNEGKVKLNFDNKTKEEPLYMKPGELVEYVSASKDIHVSKVNPEVYNAWKKNLLVFENTPLEEIGSILENNFGYKVEYSDSSMLKKRMVGTFPADNPEELLWNLKKIYGAKVIKEKKYILF